MAITYEPEKAQAGQVGREKYWGEIAIEEKIERMREVVKRIKRDVAEIRNSLRDLRNHQHNKEGEAIIIEKLRYCGDNVCESAPEKKNDNVYF